MVDSVTLPDLTSLLAWADGKDGRQVAAELRLTEHTAASVVASSSSSAWTGPTDEMRPGRPLSILPGKVEEVVPRRSPSEEPGAPRTVPRLTAKVARPKIGAPQSGVTVSHVRLPG
jgi:hypothetical protein